MIISTTTICEKFDVIDAVMVFDQIEPKGFLGSRGFDFPAGFEAMKTKIAAAGEEKGGDAVIGCDFECRVALSPFTNKQVLELTCFGTVVRIRKD